MGFAICTLDRNGRYPRCGRRSKQHGPMPEGGLMAYQIRNFQGKECACGCGLELDSTKRYRSIYVAGHHKKKSPVSFVLEDRGYTSPCWIWQRYVDKEGYAKIQAQRAHRVYYERHIGPIPEDKQLDHLCRVRCCVNPFHLEPVTNKENTDRGLCAETNRRRILSVTTCRRGHELSGGNLIPRKPRKPGSVRRECRTCANERSRKNERR